MSKRLYMNKRRWDIILMYKHREMTCKGGKKVLLLCFDPQASMTITLGYSQPDKIPVTISDIMTKIIENELIKQGEGVIHHPKGIDFMQAII